MTMSAIVRLGVVSFSVLLAAAPAWAQAPPPASAAASAQATPTALQGFGIVLVLGDMQDGGTSDSVPPGARAALADLKDFLPYRSYRVLDTSWLLASSMTRQAVSSRLRGPDEQDYEVTLDRLALPPSSMQIRFAMSEAGDRIEDAAHRDALLKKEMLQLEASRAALETQMRKTTDAGEQTALRQRIVEIEIAMETRHRQARYMPGGATLIDTTFTMSLGETVVVGTSRMRGGSRALIVLLTAATRGARPRE
jgi:hypothetical protein